MATNITDALIDELGIRLEDASESNFTEATKVLALNRGQIQCCHFLHNAYLTELETLDGSDDIDTGEFALSSLANTVLKGSEGIIRVSVQVANTGDYIWATELDLNNIKRVENIYLAGSDTNILYYIFSGTIYFLLDTLADSNAKIYYLKVPTDMAPSTGDDVDPTINVGLHEILLLFAEAICWTMDGQIDRRTKAMESALAQVEKLNKKYTPADNIGTKGRIRVE